MKMTVTDMLNGYEPSKPRWTIAEDYHPHIVSVSHHVHRHDPRFKGFDAVSDRKSLAIRLPIRQLKDK